MADLGAIKADLKTWERAFKASRGREPRKDDIKSDAAIAEKYRIYNKSRKSGTSQPAASTSRSASSGDPGTRPPPASAASSSRLRTGRSSSPPPKGESSLRPQPSLTPSKSSRFTTESAQATFMSPVKRSPAANPFLVGGTPVKQSPLNPSASTAPGSSSSFLARATAAASGTPKKRASSSTASSPAYHQPLSPNKLAALISSHSTTGAPNDAASLRAASGEGWTPRTRARKRLNGELGSGSTPVKRRRGAGSVAAVAVDSTVATVAPSKSAPLPMSIEGDEDEVIIAPTPLKESDQSRRALPLATSSLGDEGASSSDDDDMHASDAVDARGKGRATQAGKPRMLFVGGRSSLVASSEGSRSSTLHPFFTTRTGTLTAPKRESSSASLLRAPTPAGDSGQWTTSEPEGSSTSTSNRARSATPPATTTATTASKPPPAKKPRKYAPSFGKINMTAAARAKAEQAASRMQSEGGAVEGSEESEDEILKRVVQSHLLGKAGQNRTGRGRRYLDLSPIKPVSTSRRGAVDTEMDEGDDQQVDPGEEGLWQSDLDDDLRLDDHLARTSPRKKANTLYGLPQPFSEDEDDPRTLVEASDASDGGDAAVEGDDERESAAAARRQRMAKETQDLPPRLLSLLSLRSPQIASARTAKQTEELYRGIFAASVPAAEEPPEPVSLLAPRGRSGRSAKSKRGSAPRPPTPPPATEVERPVLETRRVSRKPRGEVWGPGDVGGGEMDEIEMKDDEWESEPEGWKAAGVADEDW